MKKHENTVTQKFGLYKVNSQLASGNSNTRIRRKSCTTAKDQVNTSQGFPLSSPQQPPPSQLLVLLLPPEAEPEPPISPPYMYGEYPADVAR
jgi:hypothetical protein